MGAKFQQHSSGSFTARPSVPVDGQHPGTTSLKYTLCLQRKQSGTSYRSSRCFLVLCWLQKVSHVKLISSMWLKPNTLGECATPCHWWRALRSPINVPLLCLIILFILQPPKPPITVLHGGPKHQGPWGENLAHGQDVHGHNGRSTVWRPSQLVFPSTNHRAATFEWNKRWWCHSSGILIEWSHWHAFFIECREECWKFVTWS